MGFILQLVSNSLDSSLIPSSDSFLLFSSLTQPSSLYMASVSLPGSATNSLQRPLLIPVPEEVRHPVCYHHVMCISLLVPMLFTVTYLFLFLIIVSHLY